MAVTDIEPVALMPERAMTGSARGLGLWQSPMRVIAISLSVTSIGAAVATGQVVPPTIRTAIAREVGTVAPSNLSDDSASLLKSIRQSAGFTWEQLARIFGVSRRAVHHWASGERMSSHHEALLREFGAMVAAVATANPQETRAALLAPDASGVSAVDSFRQKVAASDGPVVNPQAATQAALLGAS